MCPPPKPKKAKLPPPELDAPVAELGSKTGPSDVRSRAARGRNQLRTGLNIPSGGSGLTIPD